MKKILLFFGVVSVFFTGFILGQTNQRDEKGDYFYLKLFTRTLNLVEENYVEPVSLKKLI